MDDRVVLLLGDIGVFGFKNLKEKYPDKVINIGILEQATIGIAAGLSKEGLIPIFHSIAPFVVERALEQLKIDFCYQKLGGNFVSVGASYDYASLGCTHHCPGDIMVLKSIPSMQIVVPGHPYELDCLLKQTFSNGLPTYFRITETSNLEKNATRFGEASVVKSGKELTVVAVGPLLDKTMEAVSCLDVTVVYYTTLSPFDSATLYKNCPSNKILVVEPFYQGTLFDSIVESLSPKKIAMSSVGVPRRFLTNYGTREKHDLEIGLTVENILAKALDLINAEH